MSSRRSLLFRRGESQFAGGKEAKIHPFNLLLQLSQLRLAETERVLLLVKSDHRCPLGNIDLTEQPPGGRGRISYISHQMRNELMRRIPWAFARQRRFLPRLNFCEQSLSSSLCMLCLR